MESFPLKAYTVTVTVSDPDDPETKLEAKFERCPREAVVSQGGVVSQVLKVLEEAFRAP